MSDNDNYDQKAAEVASDFRDALQDLKLNNRPEISTLTVIAKENTEYAKSISKVLETHIRTTRPEWKLPALYVLDSIVKNVGSPYTVYLGMGMYRTFMDAYTLMDMQTRKAMEALLRTWKQGLPDSLDSRPVFPPDVTKEIENALIKYRTVALQHQQQQSRSQKQHMGPLPSRVPSETPWRNTPTPPQASTHYAPSNDPRVRQSTPKQSNGNQSAPIPQQSSQPAESSVDLAKLLFDVEKLIETAKAEFAANMFNADIQQRLKALLDLQNILKNQQLTPAQLQLVQNQIKQYSPNSISASTLSTAVTDISQALPHPPPPISSPPIAQFFQPAVVPPRPPSAASASDILSKLFQPSGTPVPTSNTPLSVPENIRRPSPPSIPPSQPQPAMSLADLLKQYNPPAPPPSAPSAPVNPPATTDLAKLLSQHMPPVPQPAPTPSNNNGNWLMDALRAQNLLPGAGGQASAPTVPQPGLPSALQDLIKPPGSATANVNNDVELTATSLKKPRPHLIASLYSALPNQCTNCGRRFPNTPQGKEMKARHMDWHFRVKDPDATKRGVQRSWYINEREWIDYREVDDALPTPPSGASGNSTAGAAGGLGLGKASSATQPPKQTYIQAPTDPVLRNAPCPICQENFTTEWMPETNEFVWKDVIKNGERVYHKSCWDEVSGGLMAAASANAGGGGGDRGTPDSVLGKRKAEESHEMGRTRAR